MRGAILLAALALAAPAGAANAPVAADARPALLRDVGLEPRLGGTLPLDAEFRDETGEAAPLGRWVRTRPTVLALVYYGCPMLCGQVLNGLAASLKSLNLDVGTDFDVVTVSFDPRDTADKAREKKAEAVARYGRPATAPGWHFLTGEAAAIERLTNAVGFRYAWDPLGAQFAHVAMIAVVTPDGRIARYLQGVEYPPRDLRLALVEASAGKIGTTFDRLLLFCYRYDASTGRYTPMIEGAVRIGAVLTALAVGTLIVVLRRREPRSAT